MARTHKGCFFALCVGVCVEGKEIRSSLFYSVKTPNFVRVFQKRITGAPSNEKTFFRPPPMGEGRGKKGHEEDGKRAIPMWNVHGVDDLSEGFVVVVRDLTRKQ